VVRKEGIISFFVGPIAHYIVAAPAASFTRRLEIAIHNQRILVWLGSGFGSIKSLFPFLASSAGSCREYNACHLESVVHRTIKSVSVPSFGERLGGSPANRASVHLARSLQLPSN
jgi:hypothetical protein